MLERVIGKIWKIITNGVQKGLKNNDFSFFEFMRKLHDSLGPGAGNGGAPGLEDPEGQGANILIYICF